LVAGKLLPINDALAHTRRVYLGTSLTYARHFMHNANHPFRLVGQLSRNAYNYWKNVSSNRSFVRRVQSALFWLPTATVLTQVGCTIRAVTGNSMQVRIHPSHTICPPQHNTARLARERAYLRLPPPAHISPLVSHGFH
jgi:hypothetical protein